jgi:hypothetical protein
MIWYSHKCTTADSFLWKESHELCRWMKNKCRQVCTYIHSMKQTRTFARDQIKIIGYVWLKVMILDLRMQILCISGHGALLQIIH